MLSALVSQRFAPNLVSNHLVHESNTDCARGGLLEQLPPTRHAMQAEKMGERDNSPWERSMVNYIQASHTLRGRTSSGDMPLTCGSELLTAHRLKIYERCDRGHTFAQLEARKI